MNFLKYVYISIFKRQKGKNFYKNKPKMKIRSQNYPENIQCIESISNLECNNEQKVEEEISLIR